MSKRDGSSPNENREPTVTMDQDEEASSSVPVKKPRLTVPASLDDLESSSSTERIDVAGRVASVRLQNFMCHANLQIDFNTHENNCFYIGGPNGSGKSALFAAINLGLGGRGSDNDRGSTVKSYIKDGTVQAKICISLTNVGLNSHPDFDELVVVERTINQTSSTYVMKSAKVSSHGAVTERVISKKKCDIDRIIGRFNIHLSNPAFWMSQDRSRSFLANFKPANVYKLYLESTNLENIYQAYQRFGEVINDCADTVQQKMDDITLESKKLKRLQEQRELQERVVADRKRMSSYKWKAMFCPLRDYEANILITQKKQELQKKIHSECKIEYAKNRTDRAVVEKMIQDVCDEVEILREDVTEARTMQNEKGNALQVLQKKAEKIKDDMKHNQYRIQQREKAIEKYREELKLVASKGKGNAQRADTLTALETHYSDIMEKREAMELGGEFNRLAQEQRNLADEFNAKDNQKIEIETEIRNLTHKIQKDREKLLSAERTKQNVVNKYGIYSAQILAKIEENRSQFNSMPKGPLGKFITVKDPKWGCAVEQCIWKMRDNFLCTSQNDSRILYHIFKDLGIRNDEQPSVIVSAFSGQCYKNLQEPPAEFLSLYRALTITDPDVNNVVIDKTNCEQMILMEKNKDAMNLMGSDNPPVNARRAYTLDGSQAYANSNNSQYRFYRGPGGTSSGVFSSTALKVDEESLKKTIKEIHDEIMRLKNNEWPRCDKEKKEAALAKQKAQDAVSDFERQLSKLRSEELKTGHKLEDLRREISNAENEDDRVGDLNDFIEENKSGIQKLKEELDELKINLEEINADIAPAAAAKAEADRNLSDMQGEIEGFNTQTKKYHEQLGKFDELGDVLNNRVSKLRADELVLYHEEAKLKSERDDVAEKLNRNIETTEMPPGEQNPPDLSDFPPTDEAHRIMSELEKKIARASEGCDESVTNEYVKEFKDLLKKNKYRCRTLEDVIGNLRVIQNARLKAYPSLVAYTDMKVCDKFRELLEVRGHFIGGLEFDHGKRTLNVNVKSCKIKDAMAEGCDEMLDEANDEQEEHSEEEYPSSESDDDAPRRKKAKTQDPKKKKKAARDLKGLSGGERSFVTASLVMSLWEVMEQPFRMMDEFDVFMDMMNRKLVMDLLVELATKKFPHNQFIFFTPQGIKELNKVDGLQVFEMNRVRE